MDNQIPESVRITKKYLGEQTMDAFAQSLGIGSTKQAVFNWINGIHMPESMTLLRVISSPTATPEARAWAGELLSVYLGKKNGGDE